MADPALCAADPGAIPCIVDGIVGSAQGLGWSFAYVGGFLTLLGAIAAFILWRLRRRMPTWLVTLLALLGAVPTIAGGILIGLVGAAMVVIGQSSG